VRKPGKGFHYKSQGPRHPLRDGTGSDEIGRTAGRWGQICLFGV